MKTLLVVLITLVASMSLVAQGPPEPPNPTERAQREVKHLTTILSLNSMQQEQAITIFTDAATAEGSVRQAERSQHDALRAAIKNDDATGIDRASRSIGQATTSLVLIKARADAAFYQVLTPEQQNKLSELESERPGPPPGPPDGMPGH